MNPPAQALAGDPLRMVLERGASAPAAARGAVFQLAERAGIAGRTRNTLLLLVSEVVSNAVLHSTGPAEEPIELDAQVAAGAVRVTVTDAGEGFVPRERDPELVEGGYGLYLLEKAADAWGVQDGPRTTVWFELAL